MCTLVMCHTRKMTFQEFENCFDSNPDGVGFAFNKKGKQFYVKGFMTLETAWKFYCKVPEGISHVAHFRLGTSGGNIPQLTHPFICSDLSPLPLKYEGTAPLVFHNGIIFDWQKKAKKYGVKLRKKDLLMSDTRLLSILIGRYGIEYFNKFVDTSDGKFIVMKDGKATLKGKFIHENGIYFSNDKYKESYYKYTSFSDIEKMYKGNEFDEAYYKNIESKLYDEEYENFDNDIDRMFEYEMLRDEYIESKKAKKELSKWEMRKAWK